jgi:hypothetical protein
MATRGKTVTVAALLPPHPTARVMNSGESIPLPIHVELSNVVVY